MAKLPKMEPCPRCQSSEYLAVYTYDSGGRHVECNQCFYLGPAEGSIRQAVKSHNEFAGRTALATEGGGR